MASQQQQISADLLPRVDDDGSEMTLDERRAWRRKWTIALVFIWIVGAAAIAVLAYFLHKELNDNKD